MPDIRISQKRASDPMDYEVWMTASLMRVLGTDAGSSARAASAVSPAPIVLPFLCMVLFCFGYHFFTKPLSWPTSLCVVCVSATSLLSVVCVCV